MSQLIRVLFFVAACVASSLSFAQDADWYFVKLSKSPQTWPEWLASYGKAIVKISGDNKISVLAFYKLKPEEGFKAAYLADPDVIIEGFVEKDGKVTASAHYQNTDADPEKLHGIYTRKATYELWGNSRKLVITEELVFPYPENFEFYGFSIKHGVDEK